MPKTLCCAAPCTNVGCCANDGTGGWYADTSPVGTYVLMYWEVPSYLINCLHKFLSKRCMSSRETPPPFHLIAFPRPTGWEIPQDILYLSSNIFFLQLNSSHLTIVCLEICSRASLALKTDIGAFVSALSPPPSRRDVAGSTPRGDHQPPASLCRAGGYTL